jgi:multidrug resistance efflux pump
MHKTIAKYLLPLLAACLVLLAVRHSMEADRTIPRPPPPLAPSISPYLDTIAGVGLVEAETENIAVGSSFSGIITEVMVHVGDKVRRGAPLFRLDDRALQAEMKVRQANLESAEANLAKLESMPRKEELPASQARVQEAKANLADVEDQFQRARVLFARRAVAQEDLTRRAQARQVAAHQLNRAQAEYDLLKAGAWEPEKRVARAAVAQNRALLAQTRTDLDLLVVRALIDGQVLQVNVRPGEFVANTSGQALVVLGNIQTFHVRVDIDEHDIPRFEPGLPARAMFRGSLRTELPMRFVHVEPYVLPKKSLTGDNTERVDTRVLRVIYKLEPGNHTVYVGQQLVVYIDARRGSAAEEASAQGSRSGQSTWMATPE